MIAVSYVIHIHAFNGNRICKIITAVRKDAAGKDSIHRNDLHDYAFIMIQDLMMQDLIFHSTQEQNATCARFRRAGIFHSTQEQNAPATINQAEGLTYTSPGQSVAKRRGALG